MELINLIKNNPLFAVAVFLLTPCIGYLLKISFSQRQDIRAAKTTIIDTFTPELDNLINSNAPSHEIMDDAAFARHESVIRNNIERLPLFKKSTLSHAWNTLAYYKDNKQIPFYAQYCETGSIQQRRETRKLAIKRIKKIISIIR